MDCLATCVLFLENWNFYPKVNFEICAQQVLVIDHAGLRQVFSIYMKQLKLWKERNMT